MLGQLNSLMSLTAIYQPQVLEFISLWLQRPEGSLCWDTSSMLVQALEEIFSCLENLSWTFFRGLICQVMLKFI